MADGSFMLNYFFAKTFGIHFLDKIHISLIFFVEIIQLLKGSVQNLSEKQFIGNSGKRIFLKLEIGFQMFPIRKVQRLHRFFGVIF
jgi:hypothetical protein